MGDPAAIRVDGLRETLNGLKAMDENASKAIGAAMKTVADVVVKDVKGRVPKRSGAMAGSYKPTGGVKGASLTFGGGKAPYAPVVEFGDPKRGRPAVKGGRWLYPSIERNLDDLQELFATELNKLIDAYGLEVDGG